MLFEGTAPGILREIRANDTTLVFLVQRDPGQQLSFLRTDLAGHVQAKIDLGPSDVIDWFLNNDQSITVDLEANDGKQREVRHYDALGQQQSAEGTAQDVYGAAALQHAPLRLTRSGRIVRQEPGRNVTLGYFPMKHVNRFATTPLQLSEQRAAIVNQVDATLTIIDLKTGSARFKTLNGPEIAHVRSVTTQPSGGGDSLLVQTVTSDAAGNIYCMLTGFRPADGAPVLVLNQQGDMGGLLRVPIVNGSSGPMVPEAMAVTNQKLFIAYPSGDIASYYLTKSP